jgi:Na+(H+)/acetate symporter ActP
MHFAAIDPWILFFSAVTVGVTVWMGFWSARASKTASDFFVAGRSVSVGWNAAAISGEYLSAASFMGVAGMVMSSGYDALWYPVCYACGYLFLLLFIAGPLRRFGAYTIPDFAEGRFDSPAFRKIAVVFVLFIGFFYTMPQMKGAGTTLAYILPGLPYWAGVVMVGAVITLNVALGGMKGITLVQAFQYWLKMFAIAVPVFVLLALYGGYGTQLARNRGAAVVVAPSSSRPEATGWKTIDPAPERRQLAWLTRLVERIQEHLPVTTKYTFSQASSSACQVAALLDQCAEITGDRYLLAQELDGARVTFGHPKPLSGRNWVAAFEAALERGPVEFRATAGGPLLREPAVILRTTPGTVHVVPAGQLDAYTRAGLLGSDLSSQRRPMPAKAPADGVWLAPFGPLTTKAAQADPANARPYALLYTYSLIIALVCGTAGLPHILVRFYTNPDGVAAKRTTMWVMILIGVFYLFPPVFGVLGRNLLPELYAAAGAKGTDKVVLELPRILNERVPMLGSVLSGITCAGAFAAFMSTFSGLLVSITGALAHDIYGRILRPQSTSNERMRMFKMFAIVCGGAAMLLGFLVEQFEINKLVGWAFAIAATSYFPLLFVATWWRGVTMKGAAAGMLAGGTLSLLAIASTMVADQAPWAAGLKAWFAAHPLARTLAEQPALWGLPLALGLMYVVSKLTRREVPADIRMKMLVLHAPESLGLKQEYIQEHGH